MLIDWECIIALINELNCQKNGSHLGFNGNQSKCSFGINSAPWGPGWRAWRNVTSQSVKYGRAEETKRMRRLRGKGRANPIEDKKEMKGKRFKRSVAKFVSESFLAAGTGQSTTVSSINFLQSKDCSGRRNWDGKGRGSWNFKFWKWGNRTPKVM